MTTPDKYIVVTPEELAVAIGPDRELLIELRIDRSESGLLPNVGLMIGMTPAEARIFAAAIVRKADEAEAGLPRA